MRRAPSRAQPSGAFFHERLMPPLTACRYGITVNAPLSGKETNMEAQEERKRPRLKGQPVWMPIDLYERLKAVREALGGSLSGHARKAVEAYVARFERKATKETRGGA
jgi:hypothetical protein